MSVINVAFSVNESYLPYCSVALTSICQHQTLREEIDFYILHNGSISDAVRHDFLEKTPCLKGPKRRVEFVEMQDRLQISKRVVTTAHITEETYFRLYLHELFPDLDKVLYLDADIVARRNIKELFDCEISDWCIAGVEDVKSYAFMKKLNLPLTEKYVNGGVILMNLAKIRKINATDRIEEILNSPIRKKITAGDQDLMALLFQNQIVYLPLKWNMLIQTEEMLRSRCGIINGIDLKKILAARSNPGILHYIGPNKPWKGASSKEYTCLWYFLQWFDYAPKTGYYSLEHKSFKYENSRKLRKMWFIGKFRLVLNKFHKIFKFFIKIAPKPNNIQNKLDDMSNIQNKLDDMLNMQNKLDDMLNMQNKLNDMQSVLNNTQIMLKNTLLYLNSIKKIDNVFLPEQFYQLTGRQVSTFELKEHTLPSGFKDTYRVLFNTDNICEIKNVNDVNNSDYSIIHFFRDDWRVHQQAWAIYQSFMADKPVFFVESSFITSIYAFTKEPCPIEFKRLYSFLVDDLSFYFDALQSSRIALYLNTPEASLDNEQRGRCRKLIRYIVDNKLTKYNFQPLLEPEILNKPGPKILVVDQTAGDASITRGQANADSFKRMLIAAINENPEATIYIKTHPDTVTRAKKCYYSNLNMAEANVIKLTEAANPYSILKYMDKVYVCTSQLGFEALMAGKKVVTFGLPIYAGWGLTDDRVPNPCRNNKLTLEDVFFALYIKFALHIHPYTKALCSVEDYLPAMVKLRSDFFNYKILGETR